MLPILATAETTAAPLPEPKQPPCHRQLAAGNLDSCNFGQGRSRPGWKEIPAGPAKNAAPEVGRNYRMARRRGTVSATRATKKGGQHGCPPFLGPL